MLENIPRVSSWILPVRLMYLTQWRACTKQFTWIFLHNIHAAASCFLSCLHGSQAQCLKARSSGNLDVNEYDDICFILTNQLLEAAEHLKSSETREKAPKESSPQPQGNLGFIWNLSGNHWVSQKLKFLSENTKTQSRICKMSNP